jgi:putative NADPH-quinone reductase
MHAHFVLAHPEPQSFNAHLVRSGAAALEAEGWTVSVSDLYAIGFDPCEGPEHFADRANPARFDAQVEQRHASETGSLPKAVAHELACLDRADLLVLQYPMWWHLPPAMLKGWFDRVLAYGAAYTSKMRFEKGRFAGKRAMLSVTVGTSRATYEHNGRSGDIDLLLWPVTSRWPMWGTRSLSLTCLMASRPDCATPIPLRSKTGCGRSSRTSALRFPASPSAKPFRSTAWRNGAQTAASRRARQSTRRLSAEGSGWC